MFYKLRAELIRMAMLATFAASTALHAQGLTQFNLPAQPLAESLKAIGLQTKINLLVTPQLIDGRHAPAIDAQLTADEALSRLLAGSGLTYQFVNAHTVVVSANEEKSWAPRASAIAGAVSGLRFAQEEAGSTDAAAGQQSADDADPNASRQDTGGERLDEIVVTARKVSERLQDIPVSITAITGEQLRNRGAVDIKDILRSVPGLAFNNVERGQSNYNIRGISTTASSPTVGVYLDDISLITVATSFSGAFDAIFFDMERVEVLKGPQGTLYGGSSMGGAIKYVSARPNLAEQSFDAMAGVASTEHGEQSYSAEGVLNLPLISDVVALRGGVSYRKEGGYIDNIAGGDIENTVYSSTPSPIYTPSVQPSLSTRNEKDYNSGEVYVGRLSLLWQPDASWSIRPAAFYQDHRQDNANQYFTNQSGLSASYRLPQPTEDRAGIYSLDLGKRVGDMQITSLTAYFDRTINWDRDYSYFIGSLVPPLFANESPNFSDTRTTVFSQELRLSSMRSGEGRLSWVAGLYLNSQDDRLVQEARVIGGEPILGTELGYVGDTRTEADQYAAFGELTYGITPSLDLTAGVRLFRAEETLTSIADGPFNSGLTEIRDLRSEEDGVNPKIGLSYKLDPDKLIYASATKGFRPGGGARSPVPSDLCSSDLARLGYGAAAPERYESDNLWSYEVGWKSQFRNSGAMLNGAVFYTDWKKIQQTIGLPNCGFSFIDNAGSARIEGIELEGQVYVTKGLQLGVNATYTDAKIDKAALGAAAFDGDQIQFVPEWMASAFGSYSVPLSSAWDLQVRADYQYRSRARESYVRTQQVLFSDGVAGTVPLTGEFQESYDVVDAFAALSNGPTTIRLFVNNALDDRPYIGRDVSFGSSRSTTLRPRTIGLEVRQRF